MGDVDEVAVERAVRGERLRLTRVERFAVARMRCSYALRMTGWGFSARVIAEKLGVTRRQVMRYRALASEGGGRDAA